MDNVKKKVLMRDRLFWMERWRHGMAWQYVAVCLFDFLVAPMFIILMRAFGGETLGDMQAWVPLTLREGGLYHLAMGAVLGVAAWTRGKEKATASESPKEE